MEGYKPKVESTLPMIAMMTAGSLDGICCSIGKMSSRTSHLSRCWSSLPMQMRALTLTDKRLVLMQSFLMRGRRAFFIAW